MLGGGGWSVDIQEGSARGWHLWGGAEVDLTIGCMVLCILNRHKRFYLQWKAFDLLNKMRYILYVVALLEACNVTNNGRHLGHHLRFDKVLKIKLKPQEIWYFSVPNI